MGVTVKYPLTAFPALLIPIGIYAIAAFAGGRGFADVLNDAVFTIAMPAKTNWVLSWGELFVIAGLGALFADLLKSTGTGTETLINHGLSVALFVVGLVFFLIIPAFVTSPFFILLVMALLDIIAGFTITIFGAKRDVAL